MKQQRTDNRRKLVIGAIVTVVVVAIAAGLWMHRKSPVDTSKGVKKIKTLEKEDVAEASKEIDTVQSKWKEENVQTDSSEATPENGAARLQDAVIMGDSMTEGLLAYEIMDSSHVVATIGKSISETEDHVATVISLAPKTIVMDYGLNDMVCYNGDPVPFKEQYGKVIDEIQKALPDTTIYVCSITPVIGDALVREPEDAAYPEFNTALQALCEEKKLTYIDVTDLATEDLYEPDGEHLSMAFYGPFLNRIADVIEGKTVAADDSKPE